LLDRIGIHPEVLRIACERFSNRGPREASKADQTRAERVPEIHEIQSDHFAGTSLLTSADTGPKQIYQHAALKDAGETQVGALERNRELCAGPYHWLLKLVHTVADLYSRETLYGTGVRCCQANMLGDISGIRLLIARDLGDLGKFFRRHCMIISFVLGFSGEQATWLWLRCW